MDTVDWFLDLLDGRYSDAEEKLRIDTAKLSPSLIINRLAISLLQRDYRAILSITDRVLENMNSVSMESLIKILEYRILSDVALNKPHDVIRCLDILRKQILTFFIDYTHITYILTIYDLLDEQAQLYLRRIGTEHYSYTDIYEFSKVFCVSMFKAHRSGFFDVLPENDLMRALSYLSIFLTKVGRKNAAYKCLNRAFNISDGYIYRVASSRVRFMTNSINKAFSDLNHALQFAEKDKLRGIEAKINIAQLYALEGEYSTALRYISDALRIYPEPLARLIRGIILLHLGRLNEAIVAFKALVHTNNIKIKINALINLAVCFLLRKNHKKAFDCLWSAYMLDPNNDYVSILTRTIKKLSER